MGSGCAEASYGVLPGASAPSPVRVPASTSARAPIALRLDGILSIPEEQGRFVRLVDRALGRPPTGPRARSTALDAPSGPRGDAVTAALPETAATTAKPPSLKDRLSRRVESVDERSRRRSRCRPRSSSSWPPIFPDYELLGPQPSDAYHEPFGRNDLSWSARSSARRS